MIRICPLLLLVAFLCCSRTATAQDPPDTLRVAVKPSPPFIIKQNDTTYSGISIWLWERIAADEGLTFRYVEQEDLSTLTETLRSGAVDLSINPLTVTSQRIEAIDFSQPFLIAYSGVASTKAGSASSIFSIVASFFSLNFLKAVLLLFLVILAFGLLAWLFERKANPEEFPGGLRGVWQGIWWSAVTMTTVGYGDKSPRTVGGRIVALIWMFTAIIIISGFTASIASSLTVNQLNTDISSLKDLNDMTVGSIEGSATAQFLGDQYVSSSGYSSVEEGLQALQRGELGAFTYDEPILKYYIMERDYKDLRTLDFHFNKQYYAFSFPKNSPLTDQINPSLLLEISTLDWRSQLAEYDLSEL